MMIGFENQIARCEQNFFHFRILVHFLPRRRHNEFVNSLWPGARYSIRLPPNVTHVMPMRFMFSLPRSPARLASNAVICETCSRV